MDENKYSFDCNVIKRNFEVQTSWGCHQNSSTTRVEMQTQRSTILTKYPVEFEFACQQPGWHC